MKYKIGDKVRVREDLEAGTVYNKWYFHGLMAEQIGKVVTIKDALWNLEGYFYLIKELDDYYVWSEEMFSGLAEESRNLIPLIAKELGVEMGEEFGIGDGIYKFNEYDFVWVNNGKEDLARNVFYSLLKNEYTIKKLPKKPLLTEDEMVTLRNIPKKYKYIARDGSGSLWVYENKPQKDRINFNCWSNKRGDACRLVFSDLFKFVKWEDEELYKIQELLEEYEKGKRNA